MTYLKVKRKFRIVNHQLGIMIHLDLKYLKGIMSRELENKKLLMSYKIIIILKEVRKDRNRL